VTVAAASRHPATAQTDTGRFRTTERIPGRWSYAATVAQNIRIWSSAATKLRSAEGVQIGGSARVLPDLLHHSAAWCGRSMHTNGDRGPGAAWLVWRRRWPTYPSLLRSQCLVAPGQIPL